jgi:hypothetical protein
MVIFTQGSALWLGLILIPVILLYFLRMRFRRQNVGSTFIWKTLIGKTSGGNILRFRSLFLLLLQCAAVVMGTLAAAGPVFTSKRILKTGTVFLVDVSASMASGDVAGFEDRVAAASASISAEIDELGADEPIMIFACASGARPLFAEPTLDKAAARAALRALAAGSESFSESDCAEDISAWLALRKESWRAFLATDGGLDMGGRRIASAFDGALRVLPVGVDGNSIGVAGLRLETLSDGTKAAAFSLWNGFSSARDVRVVIERKGVGSEEKIISAAPGWSRALVALKGKDLSATAAGAYTLRVERNGGEGVRAPGAECYLAVHPVRAVSVLLVGRDDPFLKAALAYEGISVSSAAAFPEYLFDKDAMNPPDIVISESSNVPQGIRSNLLCFGAVPPDAPVAPAARVSGRISASNALHTLGRYVDWAGATTESGVVYRVKESADIVATIDGKPAIAAWQSGGYRLAACGVDLARSDLGLKSAFPVFLQNFIQWCVPRIDDQSAYTLVAGRTVRRAEDSSFKTEGARVERDGPVVLVTAEKAGLYTWESRRTRGYLAVNVPASELDTAPRHLDIPSPSRSPASLEISIDRPLQVWLAILFLLFIAAEWFAWKGLPFRRETRL